MRRLYLILGDQLDRESLIFNDVDRRQDCFWMAEVKEESTHVWSHKQRIALFLSAMRHFAETLKARDLPLHYLKLDEHEFTRLADALAATLSAEKPEAVWLVRPGDYRVFKAIAETCKAHDVELKQAVYVDAVEWVELPNTLGMSQYADKGIMASKPYAASGNYIDKMSNYCKDCRYKPKEATGDNACPFTTLFWDFLAQHEAEFTDNPRMGFMLKNLRNKSEDELGQIRKQAAVLRNSLKQ